MKAAQLAAVRPMRGFSSDSRTHQPHCPYTGKMYPPDVLLSAVLLLMSL